MKHENESIWNSLDEAAASGLRPNLAARVLAEAGRVRVARAERQVPQAMLVAGLLCILGATGTLMGVHHLAAQREADWAQVAVWTQGYEVD